ncbi:hypothetical protein [Microbulbifer celer]|uniref:Uncharacterized protein n=1 Tax=Microbulbifer celer TaxID=435905 RepID=A0ABW3U9D0_9GAMM|nr:hypothetical protein [Microbulbifer celer]UFN57130.1 hypothetical protein LPW13_16415 [Microbulbifer celer]
MATVLYVVSSSLLASECPDSTTPRALFSDSENLIEEYFEPNKGEYSATFKGGSSATARFSLCGLGVRASYLMRDKNDDLSDHIEFFLLKAVPSENDRNIVASQLVKFTEEDFRNGVTLNGSNGDHWV